VNSPSPFLLGLAFSLAFLLQRMHSHADRIASGTEHLCNFAVVEAALLEATYLYFLFRVLDIFEQQSC
jgi:hypothetical protein